MTLIASSLLARFGREAALVAHRGGQPPAGEHLLERVEGLHAHAQAVAVAGGPHRHDHELLQVDVVVGVLAAVQDVHHGHRQHVRVHPAQVAIQRQAQRIGGRPGDRQRGPQDGVGAEAALVGRAVGLDEQAVHLALVGGVDAHQDLGDLLVDVPHRLEHALAPVGFAPVPQLDGLERAGGRPRRHRGPSPSSAQQLHLYLHGGIAARIEYLPSDNALG